MHVEHLEIGQQRLLDKCTERAHDYRVGLGARDQRTRSGVVDAVWLEKLQPKCTRGLGDRGRGQLAPTPGGTVRACDYQRRTVETPRAVFIRQAPENRGGELRCAKEDGAHV